MPRSVIPPVLWFLFVATNCARGASDVVPEADVDAAAIREGSESPGAGRGSGGTADSRGRRVSDGGSGGGRADAGGLAGTSGGDGGPVAGAARDGAAPDVGTGTSTDAPSSQLPPGGCPKAPPVDLDAPNMAACKKRILVAVGDRSRRMVSVDGTTWLHDVVDDNASGLDDAAWQVAFGMGLVVTASDYGIFTSADGGATWKKAPAPAPQMGGQGVHVSPVVFNKGTFAVVESGQVFVSTDGYQWMKKAVHLNGGHLAYGGTAVGNGRIVIGSREGTHLNVSEDAVTWTTSDTPSLFRLAFANGLFVGAGKGVRGTSKDGLTWDLVRDDCTSADPAKCLGDYPSEIVFRNGKFLLGNQKGCLETTDGKQWTFRKGSMYDWTLTSFGDTIYGVGYPGREWMTSADATSWTAHAFPPIGGVKISMWRIVAGDVLK